jgi:hypothetical protein
MVPYKVAYQYYRSYVFYYVHTSTFSDLPIENYCMLSCVADPDVYPGFRIPDQQQKEEIKNIFCLHFLAAINVTKLKIITNFEQIKRNFRLNDKEINFYNLKNGYYKAVRKYGLYPGSEIPDPDPGVKMHRIQDPQH